MNLRKNTSKPNFKVKHPYGNLITTIFMGAVLFLTSVITLGTGFFGFNNLLKTYAYTGAGTSTNPYVVYSATDFASSTIQTALKTTGKYVVLGDDVNLGSSYATTSDLKAVFDGRNYTITSTRPFVNNNYGEIKNTNFAYGASAFSYASKVVAGSNFGTVNNVFVTDKYDEISVSASVFGGVVAKNYGTVVAVLNKQDINNRYNNASATGGVIGQNYASVSQIANKADVIVSGTRSSETKVEYATAGGVVGVNYALTGYTNSIKDVYNTGMIVAGNGTTSTTGAGVRGGHAGGIVGVNAITSGTKATIANAVNFGVVMGGTGGAGANGAGGAGGTTATAGKGGLGGYGGGAGGNASGIVGYAKSSSYITVSNSYNYGSVIAGAGGNGGTGGGGGGASQSLSYYLSSNYIQVSVGASSGYGVGVGGSGSVVWSYYAGVGTVYGSGGGAGGGGAGAGATAQNTMSTTLANNGGKGTDGGQGATNTGGTAGSAGTHYGLTSGTAKRGEVGETTRIITGHFGDYYFFNADGALGGQGGIGGLQKATIYAKTPSTSKADYVGFDFVSDDGWSMGETQPVLRFEEGETYINVTVNVYYNGVDVSNTSSNYISLTNTNNGTSVSLNNGVWASYTNPVLGGNESINTSVESEYAVQNVGNYIYMVQGIEEVVGLTAPSSYGATIATTFAVNESVFRSNQDNVIEVDIYVYDQLQGAGTVANPYLVSDFYEFANMDVYDANGVNFSLSNNISTVSGYDDTFIVRNFAGILNGNGYTITRNGLYNRSLIEQNDGTISNLNIVLGASSLEFVEPVFGFLVSDNVSGTISNVNITSPQSEVVVSGAGDTNYTFGAVAGWNAGTIEYATVQANLRVTMTANQTYTSLRYVGGLVGLNKTGGSISQSLNLADLTGVMSVPSSTVTVYLGGLVGQNAGSVSYAYATSTVRAINTSSVLRYYANGITYNNKGQVDNTYFAGSVTGGTINTSLPSGATNSYVTTANTTQNDVVGWDIATDWALNSYVNAGLPALRWQTGNVLSGSVSGLDLNASVVSIDTATKLAGILNNISTFAGTGSVVKTIVLTNDIDMQGYALPVANIPSNVTINGQGFALANATNVDALFGQNSGTIKNLIISDSVLINGTGSLVGGLAKTNSGTIYNVMVNATIVVQDNTATIGGIVANSTSGNISYNRMGGRLLLENVTGSSIGYLAGTSSSVMQQNLVVALTNNASAISGAVASASGATLSNNYIATGIYGGTLKTGVTAKTIAQLKQTSTYVGWNFLDTWYQASATYPVLWESLTDVSLITIQILGNAKAYVLSYTSNGAELKEITSTTSMWVKNADAVTGNGTLSSVTGNVKFLVTDESNDYLGVTKTVGSTTSTLLDVNTQEVVYGVVADETATYTVTTQQVRYGIALDKPGVEGDSSTAFGTLTLQVTRGGQTTNVSVVYDNGTFTYDSLYKGDVVTLVYTDSANSNTFSKVSESDGYYATDITKLGGVVGAVASTTALTYEFTVGETTASKEATTMSYGVEFATLQQVSMTSSLENMQPASGQTTTLHFTVPSVNSNEYETAYVLEGVQVYLYAPAMAVSGTGTNNYDFVNFTSSATLTNATQNEGASLTVGQADISVSANYSANFYNVEIEVTEQGQSGALEYTYIMINDGGMETTNSQTVSVNAGDALRMITITRQPSSNERINSVAYYGVDLSTSALPSDLAYVYGIYLNGDGDPRYASYYDAYDGEYVATEIVYTINQDFVGANKFILNIEPLYYTAFVSDLDGAGTEQDPYLIADGDDLLFLSQVYATQSSSQYFGGKYFKISSYMDVQKMIGEGMPFATRPIGTQDNPFDGHFDGNSIPIRHLTVENEGYAGLFGVVAPTATIENVYLFDATVNVRSNEQLVAGQDYYDSYAGGIAGINYGTISNSFIANQVYMYNGDVAESMVTGMGNAYVGGLVGLNAGNIYSSYNQASVESDLVGGGLVGLSLNGTVLGSYNLGNVTAPIASGLVGRSGSATATSTNQIAYSYNAGSVTATSGGMAFGITYNYETNTQNLQQVYTFATANGAYGNAVAGGIVNATSELVVTESDLMNPLVMYELAYNNVEHVNFAILLNGNEQYINRILQPNYTYPIITTLVQDIRTIEVSVYLNGVQVQSMDDIDLNDDGMRDWNLFAKMGTSYFPYLVSYEVSATVYDNFVTTYIKEATFTSGEEVYENYNMTSSYSRETGSVETDVQVILNFSSRTIEVEYAPESAFDMNASLQFAYVPLNVNHYTISFETLYDNVTIIGIQQYVNGSFVDLTSNLTSSYSGSTSYLAKVVETNGISTGSIYFDYTNQDDVLQFRVIAGLNVSATMSNASEGTETNSIVFTQVLNNVETVVQTLSGNGTNGFVLPFGEYVNDTFALYSYKINFNRTISANAVNEIAVNNTTIFTNSYGQTGYATELQTYWLQPTSSLTDYAGAIYSAEHENLTLNVSYIETNKYLTVTYNTSFTTHAPSVNITATNILSGSGEIGVSSVDNQEAIFDMQYNQIPTISISGISAVAGQTGVFTVGGYNYRAIWVVGQNNLLTELEKASPDYAFGLDTSFAYPYAITDQSVLTLYVIELFSVGSTAALHSTSFGTSYDTSEAHAPQATVLSISANNVVSGKTLPGSMADINNAEYVDIYSSASFASSKAHLTEEIDYNRYEFYNWDDNEDQITESSYAVASITTDVNAHAYYKIVTVMVYLGSNESFSAYDESLRLVGYTLVTGEEVYEYRENSGGDIALETVRRQYLNASGDVMMEVYTVTGSAYILNGESDPYARYRIGYGETIRAERIDDPAFPYDAASIGYYNVENYQYLVEYDPNNFTPVVVAPETSAIYMTDNNYYEGTTGTVYGDIVIRFTYYAHFNVALSSSVTTYTTGGNAVVDTYFTDDRGDLTGIQPNGETVNISDFTSTVLNEGTQITMRYNVSENAGGYDLSSFEFAGWQASRHEINTYGAPQLYTYYVSDVYSRDGVSYHTDIVTENGNTYYTITYTMYNSMLDYMSATHNITILFKESSKVVTLNENMEGYGSLGVTLVGSSSSGLLGANGLEYNQFKAYLFGEYQIGIQPRSDLGVTFDENWYTINENDFVYNTEYIDYENINYINITEILNGDLSSDAPVIEINYVSL